MKRGQGVVEYLLLAALIAGVLFGVLYPIFSRNFEEIQTSIRDNTTAVLAQRELGTPLGWFFGSGSGDDFDSAGNRLQAGRDAAGRPLAEGAGGTDPSGQDGDGDGDGAGPGSGNAPTDSPAGSGGNAGQGRNSDGSNAASGRGSSRGSSGENSEEESEAGTAEAARLQEGGSGPGGGGSGSGDDETERRRRQESESEAGGEEAPEGGSGASGVRRLQTESGREAARDQGCRDIDILTLIKIAAILGLLVLGGAIALGSRKKE